MKVYLVEELDGVVTVLSENAHQAYREADVINDSAYDTDTLLVPRMTLGTMTFVDIREFADGDAARYHTGSFEMLEVLKQFCEVEESTVKAYVPFTIRTTEALSEDEMTGYGPRPSLVEFITRHSPVRPNPAYDDTRALMASMNISA